MILTFATTFPPYHPKAGQKTYFEESILALDKIWTIRVDKLGRWKAGNKIHMATGRYKTYRQFNIGREDLSLCKSTQDIKIVKNTAWSVNCRVYVDGKEFIDYQHGIVYDHSNERQFAQRDGFNNMMDFSCYIHEKEFIGKIIHWTNFRI